MRGSHRVDLRYFAEIPVAMRRLSFVVLSAGLSLAGSAQTYTISTVAGTGTPGTSGDGGPAISADLLYPQGLAITSDGRLYFTQGSDHVVRMVDTQTGTISHVAGIGSIAYAGNGGPAVDAGLAAPYDVALDAAGNLYISEGDAYRIRVVHAADGTIGTFAGTTSPGNNTEVPALQANLGGPRGIAFNTNGDLYVVMVGNDCVRYIDADSSYLHAFAGTGAMGSTGFSGDNGQALTAQFYSPYGVEVAPNGNVYIADLNNRRIRMVDVTTGIISTVAGSGLLPYDGDGVPATQAAIGNPHFMAFDAQGNLYFTDQQLHRIRKVDAVTGIISTIAGTGSPGYSGDGQLATNASIYWPAGLAVDTAGRIYFADGYNHRIRVLTPVDDTSLGETSASVHITAFPSPATSELHVRCSGRGQVELVDMQGRVARMAEMRSGQATLAIGDLATGPYTVRVAGAVPVKVIVE